MDDDNAFSPEIIKRLIEADKDVIGAAYPTREQDNYMWGPDNGPLLPGGLVQDNRQRASRMFVVWSRMYAHQS